MSSSWLTWSYMAQTTGCQIYHQKGLNYSYCTSKNSYSRFLAMHNYNGVAKKRKTQQIKGIERCYCWEMLPNGPLIEIAERMSNFEDFEALHLVCSRWNSVLRASQCKFIDSAHVSRFSHQVPWLMMTEQEDVKSDQPHGHPSSTLYLRPCSRKVKAMRLFFYSLSFRRVRDMVIRIPHELELDNNCCLYSSHGWLLVVRRGSTMSLYNPFCGLTHNYIPLPGPGTLAHRVRRFTLSASPCTKRYTAMILYGSKKVAFWRPGDENWTLLQPRPILAFVGFPELLDVTFYGDYYYALNHLGSIFRFCSLQDMGNFGNKGVLFDVDNEKFRWKMIAKVPTRRSHSYYWKAYFCVVKASSKEEERLLVVIREAVNPDAQPFCVLDYEYLTAGFRVMEIVVSPTEEKTLVKEVKSLRNISLFVGRNQAFAIEIPQERVKDITASSYYGCKPNCIYFTDDRLLGPTTVECGQGTDMGLYSLVDGSIQRHFQGLLPDNYSPMLWVEPRC
ncbi:hypothetical protein KSS87_009460 [Heliosperma pusillum]|nr:hypothetical protein KSS87_009460 [Heliosperma pusillum]